MALSFQLIGRGIIANADGYTDTATVGSTWNELGGGTDSFSTDTYLYAGATPTPLSFAGAYSAKSGYQYFDIGAGNELDFTPVTGTEAGQNIVIPILCPTLGLLQTVANKGLAIRIGTDLNNYREWIIGGSDFSNGWLGADWKPFVIDPTTPGSIADTGTYNIASIRYIGVWIDTASLAKGDNIFISQLLCCSGLKITGTSTDFWNEVIAYCTDYPNRAFSMIMEKEGIGFTQGRFVIGDAAQVTDTDVTGTAQTIKFARSEYWNGTTPVTDPVNWVTTYPETDVLIEFEESGTNPTTYSLTNSNVLGPNNGYLTIDASGIENLIMNGGATSHATPIFDPNDTLSGHVFSNCTAIKPSGATFTSVSINATEEVTTGGLEIVSETELSLLTKLSFNGYTGKNAVYIPATVTGTIALDGWLFDHSGVDIYWAGTTGNLTVQLLNGANAISWQTANPGTSTVTLENTVDLTLKGLRENVEIRIHRTDNGELLAGVEDHTGMTFDYTDGNGIDYYKFNYSYNAGVLNNTQVYIQVLSLEYVVQKIDYTLTNSNASLPIKLQRDRTYNNPV